MNAEQKKRAAQMLRRFSQANPRTLSADNAAVDMAALLHELIDADNKFKSSVRQAINTASPEARSVIVDGTPVFFSREGDDITDTHTLTPCPHCGGSGAAEDNAPPGAKWRLGDMVQKARGSKWRGKVVGFYSTEATPIGYSVESAFEPGSVQVWPEAALIEWEGEK